MFKCEECGCEHERPYVVQNNDGKCVYVCEDCYRKQKNKSNNDNVNHPSHYTQGGIECIDAIKVATVGLTGIEAVCTGNILKYIWRWKLKNGLEDVKKCRWYIDKLIEEIEGQENGTKK